MKNLVITFILALSITSVEAQQKTIDSLQKELVTAKADTNRVLLLTELVKIYYLFKPDTALILAQQAYTLSQKLHYTKGEALSKQNCRCLFGCRRLPKSITILYNSTDNI